jgi:hypothetical protein
MLLVWQPSTALIDDAWIAYILLMWHRPLPIMNNHHLHSPILGTLFFVRLRFDLDSNEPILCTTSAFSQAGSSL